MAEHTEFLLLDEVARRCVLGRRNWLFTWEDLGGERTASVLTIIGTCVAHGINPRAYLHLVTNLIVNRWPQSKLRELLPDRIAVPHPDLLVRDARFEATCSASRTRRACHHCPEPRKAQVTPLVDGLLYIRPIGQNDLGDGRSMWEFEAYAQEVDHAAGDRLPRKPAATGKGGDHDDGPGAAGDKIRSETRS